MSYDLGQGQVLLFEGMGLNYRWARRASLCLHWAIGLSGLGETLKV